MFGINALGAQGSGCMFTLCHAPLKMGVLLHKMASVCKQALMTVYVLMNTSIHWVLKMTARVLIFREISQS